MSTDVSLNPRVARIRQDVAESFATLTEMLNGPFAALPPTSLYRKPNPEEWSIMQGLAHILEFMPYWGHEISKLVAHPGQNFGRIMSNPARLQGITDHEQDTLAQMQAALPISYASLAQDLAALQDSDLELDGEHSRYGLQSLAWFIEEFVTEHLRNHLEQLEAVLALLKKPWF
jgi:hypothetical protein